MGACSEILCRKLLISNIGILRIVSANYSNNKNMYSIARLDCLRKSSKSLFAKVQTLALKTQIIFLTKTIALFLVLSTRARHWLFALCICFRVLPSNWAVFTHLYSRQTITLNTKYSSWIPGCPKFVYSWVFWPMLYHACVLFNSCIPHPWLRGKCKANKWSSFDMSV